MVDLVINETGRTKSFRFDEALALLLFEQKKGFKFWSLPTDSNYIFQDGKLITIGGVPANTRTQKQKGNRKGKNKKTPS